MAAATSTADFYNRHVADTHHETYADRNAKESVYINKFHNIVKRSLIETWVRVGEDVVDVCCGKLGDLAKYRHSGVRSVVGIDVSAVSIEAAKQRLAAAAAKDPAALLYANIRLECVDVVNQPDWWAGKHVDAVTCFFALQYMCSSRQALSNLFGLVARHLKEGGRFLSCFPDGDAVQRLVSAGVCVDNQSYDRHSETTLNVRSGCLGLRQDALPAVRALGHACEFSIKGTVTAGGSVESLAWPDLVLEVAAEHHLFPPTDAEKLAYDVQPQDWQDARDDDEPIQHFFPRFPQHVDRSWAAASRLNVAMVLVKQ